jgi:hypothetical protein
MAHRDYLIRYSNGFKRHISKSERDLLGPTLQQIGPREYLCAVSLESDLERTSGPNFLPGSFVFEHQGKKRHERMESTIGMVNRLQLT